MNILNMPDWDVFEINEGELRWENSGRADFRHYIQWLYRLY
jgi:hypothetical protein